MRKDVLTVHLIDFRIEAHIFVSYVAYCLQATLKNLTRSKASGLTPRQIFGKMKKIYMVDVRIPTTDGREIVMQRYGEPKDRGDVMIDESRKHLQNHACLPPPCNSCKKPAAANQGLARPHRQAIDAS